MSNARLVPVENRLARIARQPGGRTVAEAIAAAEARIETVREASLAALVEKADRLASLAAAGKAGDTAALPAIYDLGNAIYGLAGTFELKDLAEAAFSLCDLADAFRSGEPVKWPAIDVHVDGIRLLSVMGRDAGAAGAEAILEGLRRVRARVVAQTQD